MAENRFPCASGNSSRETVCIDTNRVLDSCRDRDCFENVRVYLTECGNEILENTGAIRARSAEIIWTYIGIDPIRFNRGFYGVTIRFYVRVTCEACVGHGKSREIVGIAILEKRVILYGGESQVSVFKSSPDDGFCALPNPCGIEPNVPTAIVEVVDPVLLGAKIMEKASECNCCCCQCNDVPERVLSSVEEPLNFDDDDNGKRHYLTVSLGIFSVVRIVRPTQLLVQASEYVIPEKECTPMEEDDPCGVFRSMPFPVAEFGTGAIPTGGNEHSRCGCNS